MIDRRRADLERHLQDLRRNDGWHPFQHFVIGLLHHAGYTDIRHSNPRSDLGRDAVAVTPDGKRCVVAVSFECTKSKVLHDAQRSTEDPNREDASVLLFITTDAPAQTTWSKWKPEVKKLGLELRMFHLESILDVATRDSVWRETCARLGITGHRPGYRLIAPYDSDLLRAMLLLRPKEWLAKRIELREWAQLSGALRNRLILGKPGAGKTTTLFVHLEATRPEKVLVVEPDLRTEKVEELLDAASGGGVIVFDDAHEKPNELRALMSALRARQRDVPEVAERYHDVRLLLTARSQEWSDIQPPFSPTALQDLGLTPRAQMVIGALSVDQCRALVRACVEQWNVEAEDRLLELAGVCAAERDATPLYVLSMLAPARVDGRLRDEHLARLPPSVLELWQMYWERLTAVEQELLRLVKLFTVTSSPPQRELFDAAAEAFSLRSYDVSRGLDALETALWISRQSVVPTCLDVQLEAIILGASDLDLWDTSVRELSADVATRAQMHNGTGAYHFQVRAPRASRSDERRTALLAARSHFSAVSSLAGETGPSLRAMALNNLSAVYSVLAGLETTREGRGGWLREALEVGEESIGICRELGVQGDLASSLNNASAFYSDLANLETTREGRSGWLRKAVEAVEESIGIRREMGVPGDLARSLNNASAFYSRLANLETTREGQSGWLRKAVEAVEESVGIRREMGVPGDLARSLNNASAFYSALAGLEMTREGRGGWLRKAMEAVEEAVRIYRELGVQGDLAISLGATCQILRMKAENSDDAGARLADLRSSRDAIQEAAGFFCESGNTPYFLMSLQNVVIAHGLVADAGDPLDEAAIRAACTKGRALAQSMEDSERAAFFADVLEQLG
jgi:hypothetical protein